ncbi:T9SS type A sorting domain-containing protein [Tenacibaculum sp. 190524A05c]|uniref:T9SS type A sorting domain-containing protein n=1 Tax=Tenacibaculum platacis TaxID=3137852 RepID=UPI0032B2B921
MKITKLLLVVFFMNIGTNAQQEDIDCKANLIKALEVLKEDQTSQENLQESIQLLTPCAKNGNTTSEILLGRIYMSSDDKNKHKEAFELLESAAKKGNSLAAADLGILYKYGKGCKLNFNKARYWFEKAIEKGNSKASYSLGYLYLKGYGNIKQDYAKAIQWFKKSKHPMAKYWLGVCYHYGYGVAKDITKANELLGTNFPAINELVNDENTSEIESSDIETSFTNSNNSDTQSFSLGEDNSLNGVWKGQLLVFDWAGENIEQKLPFELEINYNEEENNFSVLWNVNDENKNADFTLIDNALYYDELQIKLPHTSFKESIPNELNHNITSVEFSKTNIGDKEYLIGTIESFINNWNEPAAPIKIVLQKKTTFANSDTELSNDALEALTQQEAQFVKLYPNPFQNDLIISYALDKKATTTVNVASVNGGNEQMIKPSAIQKAGEYHYYVDGSQFKNGLYVITVLVDNERKTRIIVKK